MPRFDYIAVNAAGQQMTGQAEGVSSMAVGEELRLGGWTVLSILTADTTSGGLTATEAAAIAGQIVSVTMAELPLSGALRAFSEEISSNRIKIRLIAIAEALERGESLNRVLLDPALRLPLSVALILNSGLPPQAVSQLMIRATKSTAEFHELRTKVLLLLAYPACMMLAVFGLWVFLLTHITPMFSDIFIGFGVQTTPLHDLLAKASMLLLHVQVTWLVLCVTLISILVALGFRLMTAATRQRLWCGTPFFGSMYRLFALSDLADVLAILLHHRVSLPQALELAANGSLDWKLSRICRDVSQRVQAGDRIEHILATQVELPPYVQQILRWAARGQEGVEPLCGLSQLLRLRLRLLSDSVLPLIEPLMLVVAVISIVSYAASLLPPMLNLLRLVSL